MKLADHYHEHRRLYAIVFFLGGLVFDIVMLKPIDNPFSMIKFGTYLVLVAVFLGADLRNRQQPVVWTGLMARLFTWRDLIIQFCFGNLLNAFMLFYLKSASIFSSMAFVAVLLGFVIVNELPRFRKGDLRFKFALMSLCLTSYFGYVIPVFTKRIGAFPFAVAIAVSTVVVLEIASVLRKRGVFVDQIRKQLHVPHAIVQGAFAFLYIAGVVPPVPVALQHAGIYHNIVKEEGSYKLYHQRPWWRFWHNGDQLFEARPGDKVYCFMRVFSPALFSDETRVRWMVRDPKAGWITSDLVPMKIAGGRREGYRGVIFKQNFFPGRWRIQVETSDGREIGRLYFTVEASLETTERTWEVEVQ